MGTITAFAQSIESIPNDIRETQPHFIPSVPRIFEKVYSRVQSTRQSSGMLQGAIFDWAIAVGRELSRCQQRNESPSLLLSLQAQIADALVFSRIKQSLGGRVKFMFSAARRSPARSKSSSTPPES